MGSRGRKHHDDEHTYRGPDRRGPDADRRTRAAVDEVEPVLLTRKLANMIDGVNLADREIGDRLPLNRREAFLLMAEGWAQPTPADQRRTGPGNREGDSPSA